MTNLVKNKPMDKPWILDCNSFTKVIPRSFVIKHQLDTSTCDNRRHSRGYIDKETWSEMINCSAFIT